MAPPTGLEPMTHCINTTASLHYGSWTSFPCGQTTAFRSRGTGKHCRQPHFVLLNVKREYRRSSTIKKPSKKPRTWRGSFYLAPPTGLEPVTP